MKTNDYYWNCSLVEKDGQLCIKGVSHIRNSISRSLSRIIGRSSLMALSDGGIGK